MRSNVSATKTIIETAAISNIIAYAQKTYPGECCGFILENGAVIPAHNVVHMLNEPTLTTCNAFLADAGSWRIASSQKYPIICIYHSHTNGSVYMSDMDKETLSFPGLYYLIVGIIDTNPVAAKLYWWEDELLNNIDITI
jgi:proteasome lid subunit RPN8/RPN11